MFQAQLLIATGTAAAAAVFSPWFKRGGDNLLATVEVIALNGTTPTLSVAVFSKASDAITLMDGTQVGSWTDITTAGRTTLGQFSGINELVRYKFDPGRLSPTAGNWILFRMLPPVFFDTIH